jgi:hypothetical protein
VPSRLEDEYRVKVRWKADPIEIDDSAPSVIKGTSLRAGMR